MQGRNIRAAGLAMALAATALSAAVPANARPPEQVAEAALRAAPVWDGHNDVPIQIRARHRNMLAEFDFADTRGTADPQNDRVAMQTDLARLREGHVGAQFWSVYVTANLDEHHAVQATLEQIDVARRLIAAHPDALRYAGTAREAEQAMRAGKVASLLGMEGGHSIGGSLAVLRQMYALGARYMTLTHSKNTTWADSANDVPEHGGLTDFGRDVVREMQRIGMLVDLSHVSEATMHDTLDVATAPVIFSHSGARAVADNPRNVPDSVLDRLAGNGGIVMVVAYPPFVNNAVRDWLAARSGEKARLGVVHSGDPAAASAALAQWDTANPRPAATVAQIADHVDHIVRRAGIDHVGIGADFDGMDIFVEGLEDVSDYPALFTELARRGYSQADLEKIASRNMMRVLRAAEVHAQAHSADPPIETPTAP